MRNYSYTVVDDKVYYRENSAMVHPDLNATAEARIKGMVGLRDCVHRLMEAQLQESDDFFQKLSDFIPPANALRNAEMAMEDDLNMIDGIINNGPKEEKTLKVPDAPEHLPRPKHRNDPER